MARRNLEVMSGRQMAAKISRRQKVTMTRKTTKRPSKHLKLYVHGLSTDACGRVINIPFRKPSS